MSFKKDIATCNWCKKVSHKCKTIDATSRMRELNELGWYCGKYAGSSKSMHLCADCNDE